MSKSSTREKSVFREFRENRQASTGTQSYKSINDLDARYFARIVVYVSDSNSASDSFCYQVAPWRREVESKGLG
jgi:hypothetical protein